MPCTALLFAGALLLGLAALSESALAQAKTEIVPDSWRGDVVPQTPDLGDLETLHFVTDSDYPPFQYFDEEGVLTGFNVDLAYAICEVLEVECDVQQTDWDDLFAALDDGSADAAIASIRISPETVAKADFTDRYYISPARFIARKDSPHRDISPEALQDVKIAVVEGTGHEAYLKAYFPQSQLVAFSSADAVTDALASGEADLAFGDGIGLTFWLNGVTSDGCCEFRGGPFMDGTFFGEGVGIAVKKGDRQMTQILNYALQQVHSTGRYEELFLRYFPMNFF
ncbi:transporter substrate-binding domain-containing protein [Methyloligella sp. 2.7D]|uniref:transporter substrate-binding domain-containing protein n=1 Tax=unclassified Methyloligella TaxID=2625955 RepID=UPI00157C3E09|nr:transporter substrate-binding domain-containing protein [Methyloligella sp. GL2]QKP78496.1 transporter substrate-binding domain-containing protein [Methyloligella sp. GL2]